MLVQMCEQCQAESGCGCSSSGEDCSIKKGCGCLIGHTCLCCHHQPARRSMSKPSAGAKSSAKPRPKRK